MLNEDRKKRFYEYKLNTTVTNITPIVTRLKRAAKFEAQKEIISAEEKAERRSI